MGSEATGIPLRKFSTQEPDFVFMFVCDNKLIDKDQSKYAGFANHQTFAPVEENEPGCCGKAFDALKEKLTEFLSVNEPEVLAYPKVRDWVDILETFREKGLWVHVMKSFDGDDVYLKVGAPEELLLQQAEKRELELELRDGGRMPFTMENRKYFKVHNETTGSLLRPVHRQALLMAAIRGNRFSKRLKELKKTGTVKQVMVLHEPTTLNDLKRKWALSIFRPQPLQEIREYFGEQIGFYFAFLGFYTTWLIAPALVGVIVFGVQFALFAGIKDKWNEEHPGEALDIRYNQYDSVLTPVFVVFLAMWATLFVEFWKRKSIALALRWEMTDFEETEKIRDQYKFTERPVILGTFRNRVFQLPLRVSKRTKMERYYPDTKRYIAYAISIPTLAVLAVSCIVCMVLAKLLRDQIAEMDRPNPGLSFLIGQLNTIILMVFNVLYGNVAQSLNDMENYRTQTEHENALIFKTAIFQFINSYGALLILSFWPAKDTPEGQIADAQRMQFIFWQLLTIQLTKLIWDNAKEMMTPMIKAYLGRKQEQIKLQLRNQAKRDEREQKKKEQAEEARKAAARAALEAAQAKLNEAKGMPNKKKTEEEITPAPTIANLDPIGERSDSSDSESEDQDVEMGMEDKEAHKEPYDSPIDDYAEMVIQFGYIVMFAAGFPLGALISLFNNFWEIRLDAHKLCTEVQRPFARGAENIGAWQTVLEGLVLISIVSNSYFLATTSYAITMYYGIDQSSRYETFAVVEHALVIFMFALKFFVPDVPTWVQQEMELKEYTTKLILDATKESKLLEDSKEPHTEPSSPSHANDAKPASAGGGIGLDDIKLDENVAQ